MRKIVVGLSLLSTVIVGGYGPAQAAPKDVTFNKANSSCAVYCPYWMNTANTDLDGNGDPEIYWDTCEAPTGKVLGTPLPPDADTPATYYEDLRVTAPTGVDFLVFEIFPVSDWDSWICALNGELLAAGANILGENCANVLSDSNPVPFGCKERSLIPVTAGTTYILRVFNWSDTPGSVTPCKGRYEFVAF